MKNIKLVIKIDFLDDYMIRYTLKYIDPRVFINMDKNNLFFLSKSEYLINADLEFSIGYGLINIPYQLSSKNSDCIFYANDKKRKLALKEIKESLLEWMQNDKKTWDFINNEVNLEYKGKFWIFK